MEHFKAELKRARPHLHTVAPLTFWVLVCFVIFNIWIGIALWILPSPSLPFIENSVIGNHAYAYAFWFVAFLLAWAIASKNWELGRRSMMGGLFLKSVIFYDLLAVALQNSWRSVFPTIGLWGFAYAIQLGACIHFAPPKSLEMGGFIKDGKRKKL